MFVRLFRFGRKMLALLMTASQAIILLTLSFSSNYWFYIFFIMLLGIPAVAYFQNGQIWGM